MIKNSFLILIVSLLILQTTPKYLDWSNIVRLSDNIQTSRQEVIPNSFPYHAALFITVSTQTLLCGGALISSRTILSSAQCIVQAQELLVVLGAHHVNQIEATQQRFTVTSAGLISHPEFFPVSMANDLGIIQLPSPVQMTSSVAIALLPTQHVGELFVGELVTALGFGQINVDVLRHVQSRIMTNAQCQGVYGPVIVTDRLICMTTGDNVEGGHLCTADWGSGVVLSGTRLLIGIKSIGGPDTCRVGIAAVGMTRITSYLDWIQSNMIN